VAHYVLIFVEHGIVAGAIPNSTMQTDFTSLHYAVYIGVPFVLFLASMACHVIYYKYCHAARLTGSIGPILEDGKVSCTGLVCCRPRYLNHKISDCLHRSSAKPVLNGHARAIEDDQTSAATELEHLNNCTNATDIPYIT
jgi:hypothetical protein